MAISKDNVRTSLIINKESKAKLENVAKSENRSFNNLMNKILEDYLKEKKEI